MSLPLSFNDSASDSDFISSSGTPIPHKVQMIIDSLCSTQSSDMSNDVNADAQSALNLPKQSCGVKKSSHMDTVARSRRSATDSSKLHAFGSDATEGSDSDDSVDRGIEEAIQEYLKEKVDPKHKKEPIESPIQTPKVQQEGICMPEAPKQLMHSAKVLTPSNHTLKGLKGIQPLVTLKKKKKKVKENPFGKRGVAKASSAKALHSCLSQVNCKPPSHRIKVEEDDLINSSSDDGIEEAIQKFQQEEKERHEGLRYFQLKEELDSSSDDGIEEAIRNYQQERQKEKEHKPHPKKRCLADHISLKPLKKLAKKKNNKKNAVEPKEVRCSLLKPVGLSLCMLPTCSLRVSDDSLCSARAEEPEDEQQSNSMITVNTSAELMCAEAILDISKTVMPAAFEPTLDLTGTHTTETSSFPHTCASLQRYEKSDESSVDSEDGIEQEIRKFLELKAKLHEQASTADYHGTVSAITKAPQHIKVEENQNKTLRLSFSRKRKRKEEDSRRCQQGIASNTFKEKPHSKPSTPSDFPPVSWHMYSPNTVQNSNSTQNSPHHSITEESQTMNKGSSHGCSPSKSFFGSERDHSNDKSSSLDSDEDLDAAIKDLLKTKKKVKKKVRDMKLKAQKSHKPIQLACTNTLKKYKSVKDQKLVLAAKPIKPNAIKSSKGLVSIPSQGKGAKPKGLSLQRNSKKPKVSTNEDQFSRSTRAVRGVQSTHVDEDSSSVDSDDSIEQEIRRFLAEKAKASSTPVTTLNQDYTGGIEEAVFSTIEEKKVQIEEPETKSSDLSRALLRIGPNQEEQTQGIATGIKGPGSSFASYCRLEEGRTGDQLHKNTLHQCRNISLDTDNDCAQKVTERFTDRTDPESFVINVSDPQEPKGEVQHQNLFLMKHDNCSISTARQNLSADLSSSLQNRSRIPLKEVISTVCSSPPPVKKHFLDSSSISETIVVAKEDRQKAPAESRSESFDLCSWERKGQWDQPPNLTSNTKHTSSNPAHLSQHPPPYPSHLSCVPLPLSISQPRAGASVVHLRRDQASVVALSAHKSNRLQLRKTQKDTRNTSEGREEEQERCIDETDVESGEEGTDKRQQQCSQ